MTRHATRGDTTPDPRVEGFETGGTWTALCASCGWEIEGFYPAGKEAEGLALAHLKGGLHETDELLKEASRRYG